MCPTLAAGLLTLLALASLGCATRQQLLEIEADFKTRTDRMEATQAADRKRIEDLTAQLAAVRTSAADATRASAEAARTTADATRTATEATRAGQEATRRADAALAKGEAVNTRLAGVLANRFKRTRVQEFTVTFETGRADLSGPAQQTLLGAVRLLADNASYTADIVGYTDDLGASGSNVTLSWRREEVVRRFMVERGAELNRLSFIGFGEDLARGDAPSTRAQERYVLVRVFRPVD